MQQDGQLEVEQLQPSLSSSSWPATTSVKDSARASTALSTAAAAQAVRWGRASSTHHEQQLCSREALPASPRCARATQRLLNFSSGREALAWFGRLAATQRLLRPSTAKRLPTALQALNLGLAHPSPLPLKHTKHTHNSGQCGPQAPAHNTHAIRSAQCCPQGCVA